MIILKKSRFKMQHATWTPRRKQQYGKNGKKHVTCPLSFCEARGCWRWVNGYACVCEIMIKNIHYLSFHFYIIRSYLSITTMKFTVKKRLVSNRMHWSNIYQGVQFKTRPLYLYFSNPCQKLIGIWSDKHRLRLHPVRCLR